MQIRNSEWHMLWNFFRLGNVNALICLNIVLKRITSSENYSMMIPIFSDIGHCLIPALHFYRTDDVSRTLLSFYEIVKNYQLFRGIQFVFARSVRYPI